jgi:glutathione synthase/RimK-type ligase-like ATP-grasp enzyme
VTDVRVGLATAAEFPTLSDDDRRLCESLQDAGIDAQPVIWSDESVGWDAYDLVVVRSCWDYHRRLDAFRSWIETVETHDVDLWNPAELLRWNLDKSYLGELRAGGVPTVPTVRIEQSSPRTLRSVLRTKGWDDAVVKPTVAATAYRTVRVTLETATTDQQRLEEVLAHSDALVQPFVPEIQTDGEWSLVYLDGEFSHSVKKYPQSGEYRVQTEFGGRVVSEPAPRSLVDVGHRALAQLDRRPLYARVDGVETEPGARVMEVELIDPELFFRHSAAAIERFVGLVADRLGVG